MTQLPNPVIDDIRANRRDRVRRIICLSIWKRLLWRTIPIIIIFLIVGSMLLEAAHRFVPNYTELHSPALEFSIICLILSPLIFLAVRRSIALAVNLELAHLEVLMVLSNAIAKRDDATEQHNLRVAIMAVRLASALQLPAELMPGLFIGGLLHDIGKIGIRDNILLKPGRLTPDERCDMETHVLCGVEILHGCTLPPGALQVVLCHHERFDGAGYPQGLKGTDIPAQARLFTIIDTFDALAAPRPYKPSMSLVDVVETMRGSRGSHFDPDYLDRFITLAPTLHNEVADLDDQGLREVAIGIIERNYQNVANAHAN